MSTPDAWPAPESAADTTPEASAAEAHERPAPVEAALLALQAAATAPLPERPALLEAVHAQLAAALGAVDGS